MPPPALAARLPHTSACMTDVWGGPSQRKRAAVLAALPAWNAEARRASNVAEMLCLEGLGMKEVVAIGRGERPHCAFMYANQWCCLGNEVESADQTGSSAGVAALPDLWGAPFPGACR